jgi:hypothetical protein
MITDIIYDANQAIEDYLVNVAEVTGEELGLDPRALYRGWADSEVIVVKSEADRSLQYYGGFEYVDKEARTVIGDYVIYNREYDDRVESALDYLKQTKTEEDA